MTRLYLPTTLGELARQLPGGSLRGPEGFVADGDDEQSEYLALMSAADVSAALPGGGGRRVVVVADVADVDNAGDPGRPVPLRSVVAVHADPVPHRHPDDDLAWYATQELDALVSGASAGPLDGPPDASPAGRRNT